MWNGEDIVAPINMKSSDMSLIGLGRKYVEDNNDKVFVVNPDVKQRALDDLSKLEQALNSFDTNQPTIDCVKLVREKANLGLLPETCQTLLDNNERITVLMTVRKMVDDFYARGMMGDVFLLRAASNANRARLITSGNDHSTTMSVKNVLGYPGETFGLMSNVWLRDHFPGNNSFDACADVGRQVLNKNVSFSAEETERLKNNLMNAINAEYTIPEGSVILRSGAYVTPEQEMMAQIIREYRWHSLFLRIVGDSLCVLLLFIWLLTHLRFYHPIGMNFSWRTITLVALPLIVACLVPPALVLSGLCNPENEIYCFPCGMIGMIFALLYHGRISSLMVIFSCILYGIINGMEFEFLPFALAPGLCVIMPILRGITERSKMLNCGVLISIINIIVLFAITWLNGVLMPDLNLLIVISLSGFISYGLTMMLLPFIEVVFRVTTPWRLWEITSLYHPIIKELEAAAPGSFQHVQDVAKLAESGAEALGADILLVRAGAFFHDIGKKNRPKYFTENQSTEEERHLHGHLAPVFSAQVIKQHVLDGIRIAKESGLPRSVVNFIPEHHGTSLISYFYMKAQKEKSDNQVISELDFRYPGPRPQTLETAIVMLADSVEAAATAKFKNKNRIFYGDLRKLVNAIVNTKLDDHQLDECPITLKQISILRDSFVKTLQSRYHSRIDYPTTDGKVPNGKNNEIVLRDEPIKDAQTRLEAAAKEADSVDVSETGRHANDDKSQ